MLTIELPALYVNSVITQTGIPRPSLINRNPEPNETKVPLDSTIALEIVDTDSAGVDRDQTHVWVNDFLAFEGGAAKEIKAPFSGPRDEVIETADTLRIVLDPQAAFPSQGQVQIHIVSATNDGAPLNETYLFTAEDLTRPKLIAAQAVGPKTIRLSFDEPVSITSPLGFSVNPKEFPAVTPQAIKGVAQDQVVIVSLDTEMTPGIHYQVTATSVTDLKGNPVDPGYNGAIFKGFVPHKPQGRRFDLWSMIPVWNRREDITGDLKRFIDCLQEALDWLLADVDRFPDIFDIERAPESFLNLILKDLGNPFPFDLDELAKRRLASVLVEMYRQKGTAVGIKNAIRFFLGIHISAITPFAGNTLILGESELGIDWELGPSNRFARYAFNVEVANPLTETEKKRIRTIVDYLKPAHTHFVDLIEPSTPIEYDHWVIGISELGVESALH